MKLFFSLLPTTGQGSEVTRGKEIVARGKTDRSCYVLKLHVQNVAHNAPQLLLHVWEKSIETKLPSNLHGEGMKP